MLVALRFWQVFGGQFCGAIALLEFVLKSPCQQLCSSSLAPCQRSYACSIAQCLHTAWQVLGAQFFGAIALMEFVLKNPCQQLCSFSLAPCQRSYACSIAQCLHTAWQVLGPQFSAQSHWYNLSWKPVPTALDSASVLLPSNAPFPPTVSRPSTLSSLPRFRVAPSQRGSPQAISHRFPSVHPVVASVYCSLPTELFPNSFPRLPVRPPWPRFRVAPSQPSLLPKLFPTVSVRPPCRRFRVAPSQRSFPQAISHGFPSVHPVVTSVSLPPNGALPKSYFAHLQISRPSTLSSPPFRRTLPWKLSPSYFPRFPVRPPCPRFRLAPSHRSSPQAISHGFPSVHPVVAEVSLPPRQSKLNENPSIGDAFGKCMCD